MLEFNHKHEFYCIFPNKLGNKNKLPKNYKLCTSYYKKNKLYLCDMFLGKEPNNNFEKIVKYLNKRLNLINDCKILIINNNYITKLPNIINNFKKITTLNVEGNNINELNTSQLPKNIKYLKIINDNEQKNGVSYNVKLSNLNKTYKFKKLECIIIQIERMNYTNVILSNISCLKKIIIFDQSINDINYCCPKYCCDNLIGNIYIHNTFYCNNCECDYYGMNSFFNKIKCRIKNIELKFDKISSIIIDLY
jgi:hypothetical protein